MNEYSSSGSNISLDSLETEFKKKSTVKNKISDEGVDTILVPFYEKDVLMKVSKGKKFKNKQEPSKIRKIGDKLKKESPPVTNYLVNKDASKIKHTTYLGMFRKQFGPKQIETRQTDNEVRSISPEFGDTERESFREDLSNPTTDFFNTESYNEIYYDKIINQEINNIIEKTYEEQLKFSEDKRSQSPDNLDDNNLRSVSDVSQPRRIVRRATVQPVTNVKLGGLGPDMENIRPRLERARSLQRYSEKVRMENRVKIYKKSVQDEIEKRTDKELPKRQDSAKPTEVKGNDNSLIANKTTPEGPSKIIKNIWNSKSKSANGKQTKQRDEVIDRSCIKNNNLSKNVGKTKTSKKPIDTKVEACNKERIKSSDSKRYDNDPVISQVNVEVPVPPVQINFLVNMGGLRCSSALRKLEAKHRLYQEKVKAFTMNNNLNNEGDDSDNIN